MNRKRFASLILEEIFRSDSSSHSSDPFVVDLVWWHSYPSSKQKETTNQRFSSSESESSSDDARPDHSPESLSSHSCRHFSFRRRFALKFTASVENVFPRSRWIRLARQSSCEHDLSQWSSTTECSHWPTTEHESSQWTILLESDRRSPSWLSTSISGRFFFGVEAIETRRTLVWSECRDELISLGKAQFHCVDQRSSNERFRNIDGCCSTTSFGEITTILPECRLDEPSLSSVWLDHRSRTSGKSFPWRNVESFPRLQIDQENYYVFSVFGVLNIRNRGLDVEFLDLAEWYRHAKLWHACRQISFFRDYLLRKQFHL